MQHAFVKDSLGKDQTPHRGVGWANFVTFGTIQTPVKQPRFG